jgi:hypothetical protein
MIVRTSRFRYNFPQSTDVRSLIVCATRDDGFTASGKSPGIGLDLF